jgi:hypothetical protein
LRRKKEGRKAEGGRRTEEPPELNPSSVTVLRRYKDVHK